VTSDQDTRITAKNRLIDHQLGQGNRPLGAADTLREMVQQTGKVDTSPFARFDKVAGEILDAAMLAISDNLAQCLSALRGHRLRTSLTMLGLTMGVATLPAGFASRVHRHLLEMAVKEALPLPPARKDFLVP
jgi:hypothetical protein